MNKIIKEEIVEIIKSIPEGYKKSFYPWGMTVLALFEIGWAIFQLIKR